MEIRDVVTSDPVAELYLADAYMRWALMASEEVVGKNDLNVILRQVGLEHLINNYPSEQLKVTAQLTLSNYATLNAGLLNFFGRAAKSMTLRIGRQTDRYAIEHQGPLFGTAALLATKVLPVDRQIKMGLTVMQLGLHRMNQAIGQERRLSLQDRGEAWAYIDEDRPMSAGKPADEPIGWIQTGALQGLLRWQTGQELDVEQIACRSMGDQSSVWLVNKKWHTS